MSVAEDDRMRVPKDVHVREFDGELVILDLAKGDYFGVNEVGARLWVGLARGKSVKEIAAEFAPDYDVTPSRLVVDLLALANDFVGRGLLVPC